MNGLWSGEVSSVDLGVTWTQWRPGLYRENKNRDPQAHGPCRGRGLDMVGHFRKEKKKKGKKWCCIRGDVLDLKHRLEYHKCYQHVVVFKLPILPGESFYCLVHKKTEMSINCFPINFTPNNINYHLESVLT